MKYRKKATSIEAFQYDGDFINSDGEYYVPQWAVDELRNDGLFYYKGLDLMLKTTFCDEVISIGDYIVNEEGTGIYIVSEECFKRTYERVEE